jgi:MFS family permease
VLVLFVWWEARTPRPIIRVAMFREPRFALVNLAGTLMYLVTFAVMLLTPYFLARFSGLPLPVAGLLLAVGFVAMAASSSPAGWLVGRFGAARMAPFGPFAAALGLGLIGFWRADTGVPAMICALALQGAGTALFQVAYMELVMASAPLADRGVAGSLSMLTRTLGVVVAAAGLTLIFQTREHAALVGGADAATAFLSAYRTTFLVAAAIAAATGLALAGLLRPSRGGAAGPVDAAGRN